MKITIINPFISEARNVYNVSAFDRFADNYKNEGEDVVKWILTQFRRWAIEFGPAVEISTIEDAAPDWAKTAIQRGDKLFNLDYEALKITLDPIIDYFRYLKAENKNFSNISGIDAIKQQEEWHAKLASAKKKTIDEDGIQVVHTFPDGYFFARLTGKKSLNREGNIMGHCVGSYYEQVKEDKVIIFSLRDPKNEPHVTIEVQDRSVEQIKGKANEKVIAKYRPYCIQFLSTGSFNRIAIDELGVSKLALIKTLKEKGLYKILPSKSTNFGNFVVAEKSRPEIEVTDNVPYRSSSIVGVSTFSIKGLKSGIIYADYIQGDSNIKLLPREGLADFIKALQYFVSLTPNGFSEYIRGPQQETKNKSTILNALTDTILTKTTVGEIDIFTSSASLEWVSRLLNIRRRDADTLVLAKDKILLVGKTSTKSIEFSELDVKGFDYISDIAKWLGKKNVTFTKGNLKKEMEFSEKLDALRNKKQTVIDTVSTVSASNIPPALFKALVAFRTPSTKAKPIFNKVSKIKTVLEFYTILKENKIPQSGYLYDYFFAFFCLAFVKDKKLQMKILKDKKSYRRQYMAFTAFPMSIYAGAFGREAKTLDTPLLLIRKYTPKLFPFTAKEIDSLGLTSNAADKIKKFYGYEK